MLSISVGQDFNKGKMNMELLIKGLSLTSTINEDWIKKNCYIAGGACVSNFTQKPINDVDLYFKTKAARDEFIKNVGDNKYITKEDVLWKALLEYDFKLKNKLIEEDDDINVNGIKVSSTKFEDGLIIFLEQDRETYEISSQLFEKQKWMFENGYDYCLLEKVRFEVDYDTFLGNKSITIKAKSFNGKEMLYQFILRFYGEPQKMMDESFDFQHCKIAYDLATNQYIASEETWKCLSKREIIYINSFYPISSIKRLFKYRERGFAYKVNELVKIIKDIHSIDVDNKFVIEDQMVGYYEDFDYGVVFNEKNFLDGVKFY